MPIDFGFTGPDIWTIEEEEHSEGTPHDHLGNSRLDANYCRQFVALYRVPYPGRWNANQVKFHARRNCKKRIKSATDPDDPGKCIAEYCIDVEVAKWMWLCSHCSKPEKWNLREESDWEKTNPRCFVLRNGKGESWQMISTAGSIEPVPNRYPWHARHTDFRQGKRPRWDRGEPAEDLREARVLRM